MTERNGREPIVGTRWVGPQRSRVYTVLAVYDGTGTWAGLRLVRLRGEGLKSVRRESVTYFLNNFTSISEKIEGTT